MKKHILILSTLLIVMLYYNHSYAQEKHIKTGDEAFKTLQYQTAIQSYLKAWSKMDKNSFKKQQLAIKIADCYFNTRNDIEAVVWYRKIADEKIAAKQSDIYNRLGLSLMRTNQYVEAEKYFLKKLSIAPDDAIANLGLQMILFQKKEHEKMPYHIENLNLINSVDNDFGVAFSNADHKEIIFSSHREESVGKKTDEWTGASFSDLYIASYDNDQWKNLTNADGNNFINTEANEGSPTFNGRFTRMYFTRCLKGSTEITYCEIQQSDRKQNSWSKSKTVLAEAGANIGHPWISADELTIYYVSNQPGGFGGKDIWMATRTARHKSFDSPVNLGNAINTPLDEMFPYLWNDSVLFFASEGHPGFGGLDIFKSVKKDTIWSTPENLQQPINSNGDDFNLIPDGEKSGLFSSNRIGGLGGDDLYSYTRYPLYFDINGYIIHENLATQIKEARIKLLDNDQTLIAETLSDNNGFYAFDSTVVLEDNEYHIKFEKEEYFAVVKQLNTKGFLTNQSFTIDAVLAPIPEKPIVLPEIRYELDRWDLLTQYKDSLKLLVTIMRDNTGLIIELRSHTDPRASDTYNDELSQKRAQTVVDYLVSTGIDPDRLNAKGYGKRVPRIMQKSIAVDGFKFNEGTELTEKYMISLRPVKKQEAAYSLSRRTEFRVLAKDFKPKEEPLLVPQPEPKTETVTDKIDYELSITGKPLIEVSLNQNTFMAEWRNDQKISSINAARVFELLINESIDKSNIKAKNVDKAIKYSFKKEEAILTISEVMIGDKVLTNCDFLIVPDLEVEARFGQNIIKQLPTHQINEATNTIVFE